MGTEETTARKALDLIREHAAQRHNQFGGSFEDWILDVCYDARTRDMEALEARGERCDPDVAQAIGESLVQYARALRERNEALVELEAARTLIRTARDFLESLAYRHELDQGTRAAIRGVIIGLEGDTQDENRR